MNRTTVFGINLGIGLLFIFFASYIQAQSIPVAITGVRSQKGIIMINVFKDQVSYEKEQPFKKFTFDKHSLDKGVMTVKLSLDPGVYGITMVDDENENGKIDKNLIGMPKEGFGFSNFFLEKMKKPSFQDFKVDLNTNASVKIRVKYM